MKVGKLTQVRLVVENMSVAKEIADIGEDKVTAEVYSARDNINYKEEIDLSNEATKKEIVEVIYYREYFGGIKEAYKLRCSKDTEFLLNNRTYIRADELQKGHKLYTSEMDVMIDEVREVNKEEQLVVIGLDEGAGLKIKFGVVIR